MESRIILIFVSILTIYFNAFVSNADACVENLQSLMAVFNTSNNILKIQETFYPQNTKPAPHYVLVCYCYEEPCDVTNVKHAFYWADNPIYNVVDYYLFKALTFELLDLGDIRGVFFVVPQPCDKELLLDLTKKVT